MELGAIINELRKKKGITQVELASKIGKSPTALSQIIKGRYNPSPETLKMLSEVLEVPLPVIYFLSISEEEIPEEKKELYAMLAPAIKEFLIKVFGSESKETIEGFSGTPKANHNPSS